MDRTNKNWNNEITDEEILNRDYSIGYLIQTNQHLDIFKRLKDLVLSTYKVTARFEYQGFNGHSIYANGQKLVWREDKRKDFSVGKEAKVIIHNLSHKGGGSNRYPSISREAGYCVVEFISYGLPFVNKSNGWSIHVLKIDKL